VIHQNYKYIINRHDTSYLYVLIALLFEEIRDIIIIELK